MGDKCASLLSNAREEFNSLSHDEEKALAALIKCAISGEMVDYSTAQAEENDPANGKTWDKSRNIKPSWLEWICNSSIAASLISYKGLRIKGARFEGAVDLSFAQIGFPLAFIKCSFDKIYLTGAKLRFLSLIGCRTKEIEAINITVETNLVMSDGFVADGEINLICGSVGGVLNCDGAQFKGSSRMSVGGYRCVRACKHLKYQGISSFMAARNPV